MPRYSIPTPYTLPEIEADPIKIIAEIRAAHEDLHSGGIGFNTIWIGNQPAATTAEWTKLKLDKMVEERCVMTDERQVQQFLNACRYIDAVPRTKGINRGHNAYGWKHRAERWCRMQGVPYGPSYVSEGMFTTAAIAMGLLVERPLDGFTMVNLGAKAWKMGCETAVAA